MNGKLRSRSIVGTLYFWNKTIIFKPVTRRLIKVRRSDIQKLLGNSHDCKMSNTMLLSGFTPIRFELS